MRPQVLSVGFVLVVMATGTLEFAQGLLPPPADQDPFVGEWRVNRDKSHPRLNRREATYWRTIVRDGNDWMLSSAIRGVKHSQHHYRVHFDGAFHPAPDGSRIAREYKARNLIEGKTISPDQRIEYWSDAVSADGREMKITLFRDKLRTKVKSYQILDRVK